SSELHIRNGEDEEYDASLPPCQFIRAIKHNNIFMGGYACWYLPRWRRYRYCSCFISLWLYMDLRNNFRLRCLSISLVYAGGYGRNIKVDIRKYVFITSFVGWVRCCILLLLYIGLRNNLRLRCLSIFFGYAGGYGRNIKVDIRKYVFITSFVGWVRCCMCSAQLSTYETGAFKALIMLR